MARVDTEAAARHNREAWDAFRRQRDDGLVGGRRDVVARLVGGHSYLHDEYRALVGDVAGKRLLDLGCGDGAELLSWARLGASVVGVDNSPRQLAVAQAGAVALGLPAGRCRLILGDLLELPDDLLRGEFDVAFSVGVAGWIGDLDRWFTSVYRALAPGGVFLLGTVHSLAAFYRARDEGAGDWASYFDEGPFVERLGEGGATHRWNPAGEAVTTVQWMHTVGHVVTAVARAGMRISHLVELPDGASLYGIDGGPGELVVRATKDDA